MKSKNIKCNICDSKLNHNEELNKYICSTCNATHDTDIFSFLKKREFLFRFKKYDLLIAPLGALYLIFIMYRNFY